MFWKKDNEVSNKDVLNTLTDMKDNHLSHIQQYTKITNILLTVLIAAVLLAPFMM